MNPHQPFPASISGLTRSLTRHRDLIVQLTLREVIGRYRGSFMGVAWSLFNPILMLLVYTFVFSVVFKARWSVDVSDGKSGFAIVLFVGMIVHGIFSECINRAPTLLLTNANYVKKVVFPIEILPWVSMGSALFHASISLMVLIAAQLLMFHTLPWTFVFFPLVLAPLILATMGVAWLLAALGVYIRDISQMTGMLSTVMLFLSPVFYPVSALPPSLQKWILLNPLTFIIEDARTVLVFGHPPEWDKWAIAMLMGLLFAWAGFAWFQKTRKGFSDVL